MFVKGKPIIQFEFISNIHSLSDLITENSWFVFEQGKIILSLIGATTPLG